MKIQIFNKIPAKTTGIWKVCLIFNEIFHKRRIILKRSIQFWVNFSVLVSRIDFILHILLILDSINNLAMQPLMLDQSKITKKHFWMIQRGFWLHQINLILHILIVLNKYSSRLNNGITHGLHMDDYITVVQKYDFFLTLGGFWQPFKSGSCSCYCLIWNLKLDVLEVRENSGSFKYQGTFSSDMGCGPCKFEMIDTKLLLVPYWQKGSPCQNFFTSDMPCFSLEEIT